MSIIQFLKLLKKNLLILVLVPGILGSLVWYSTRNEVKMYSSSGKIYTGVGSGLSLESQSSSRLDYFGSKMEFDNIINIFKVRATHKDVLIRLFAQGLILDSWDPRFISRSNYKKLHDKTPDYIKQIVRGSSEDLVIQSEDIPMVMVDTSSLKNAKIVSENIYHIVHRNDDLMSISEEFNSSVSDLMNWNQLTKIELDKGQKLIVNQLRKVIFNNTYGGYDTINLLVPDTTFFVKADINIEKFELVVEKLKSYSESNDTNYIYKLLNYSHPYYSYKAIKDVKVKRIQGSGLLEVSFKTSDPGVCQQTLSLLIASFERSYARLFENQSDHIIAYFERRVAESSANLQAAENRLLKFNQDNNIINYYEQTRHISEGKELLDEKFNDEKMRYTAADSVLRELEIQMEAQKGISAYNSKLLKYRDRLSELTYQIAINELNNSKDPKAVEAIKDLIRESADVKQKIINDVAAVYELQFSPEGISRKEIILKWLETTIKYEESKAKLSALYNRKKEFQLIYETFAPLGAKLSRIEREIEIYEQQYLTLLHSLNLAKLKQQNLAFKSNIKVVDPPYFPLKAEGSKRKLFIVAAALVGLILVLFVIIVLEYFDDTIKTPGRAVKKTGLELFTAYPRLVKKKKNINYEFIQNRLLENGTQKLLKAVEDIGIKDRSGPVKTLVFSTLKTDGKSLIIDGLTSVLRGFGFRVLSLNYSIHNYHPEFIHPMSSHADNIQYKIGKASFSVKTFDELYSNIDIEDKIPLDKFDFVFVEMPAIITNVYSPDLVEDTDLSIMIIRANRTWQEADENSLKTFMDFLIHKPMVMLNGVNSELLQGIIGEVPRKRSRIRRVIKKMVRLQFFERQLLKK